jgi:hypothetical protein
VRKWQLFRGFFFLFRASDLSRIFVFRISNFGHQLKMATYPWQEQLFKSRAGMVLLNCSRQAVKSTCVAFLALLEALTIQEHLVLMLSRSARLSKLLLSKVRDFMLRISKKRYNVLRW